jgi:hypothetical protein
LLSAGTISWPEAWVYTAIQLVTSLPFLAYLQKHSPDLLDERARGFRNPGTKRWDKYVLSAFTGSYFLEFVLAGLDRRFSASWWQPLQLYPFSRPVTTLGVALFVSGYVLMAWAMCVNR